MKTLTGLAIAVTVMILAYIIHKPTLRWAFNRDQPPTPDGWEPKLITWKHGVRQ